MEYIDGLRVGIGGGSLCTTRVKTGFGVPNVSCLEDISSVENTHYGAMVVFVQVVILPISIAISISVMLGSLIGLMNSLASDC